MIQQSDSNTIQLETLTKVYLEDGSTEWRAQPQDDRDHLEVMYQEHLDGLYLEDYYDSAWTD